MKAKVIKTGEIVEVYHETQHGRQSMIYKECVFVNGRMWSEEELDFADTKEANEAPEKIYIEIRHPFGNEFTQMFGFENKGNSDDIEYLRTDVFIEKAEQYLYKMLSDGRIECGDIVKLIDGFKAYIEGE